MIRRPPRSPLFPYTPLSRSKGNLEEGAPAPSSHFKPRRTHADRTDVAVAARPIRLRLTLPAEVAERSGLAAVRLLADRKSTRLNSSHSQISYAVFCLKKKKN